MIIPQKAAEVVLMFYQAAAASAIFYAELTELTSMMQIKQK